MSRLFGKAKKAPSAADQIGKMKETLANMDQREALLNKKIKISLTDENGFTGLCQQLLFCVLLAVSHISFFFVHFFCFFFRQLFITP